MRAVSFQATLLVVLLGSCVAARAGSDDFIAELDQPVAATTGPKAVAPLQGLDLTPTQSLAEKVPVDNASVGKAPADKAVPAPKAATAPVPAQSKAKADAIDPEPDAVIVPPSAGRSNDPLDARSAPPAKLPGKADAAGPDTPRTDAPAEPSKAVVQEPLPAVAAAIKAVLDKREAADIHGAQAGERRKERAAIAFFYAARSFAPLWSVDGKAVPAVDPVLARLAHAGDDALTIGTVPAALKAQGTPDVVAESEVALTEAVVAYARQATGSRVQPFAISPLIGSKPSLADPAEVLDAVATAGGAGGDKLQAENPIEPRYVALREKLAQVRTAKAPVSVGTIAAGPTLKIGMHDARVPLLRARFGIDSALDPEPDDLKYDDQVAAAVQDFQRANGLPETGTLNKRTVAAMGGGKPGKPAKLEGTLIANMEIWRWMPRDMGQDRIEVNIPDFTVTVFHDGAAVSQNRVVVGKMDTPTPLFSNTMKYLIVNPYWNVPQSIIKNEMLPKGGGSLSYLEGRGYSVSSHNGMAVVKQLPGDKNALGRIKFLFPNDYSVYLHDTPSKSLFSSSKRAFSHGCVRVDKPFAFAESVLNDASDGKRAWSQERLEDMIGDKERYVNLPAPLPIHIEYFTASVEPGETVKLRDDVYGYANAVAGALGQSNETIPVAGHSVPKPQVAEHVRSRRRYTDADTATATPAPVASRSFWNIFDPR